MASGMLGAGLLVAGVFCLRNAVAAMLAVVFLFIPGFVLLLAAIFPVRVLSRLVGGGPKSYELSDFANEDIFR